jgi:hypothetical protein
MRISHILMACLIAIACLGVLGSMTVELMDGWGLPDEALNNGTNATGVIHDLDIFNSQTSVLMNSSQYAPGQTDSDTPDSTSGSGSQAAIMATSFTSVLKFSAQAITLPGKIVTIIGNYLHIPAAFLTILSIFFILTVIFLIVGAVFQNRF